MKNLDNLFIIRSPLQLINSLEAIEYFKLKNNILVLIYNNTDNTNIQMDKMANYYSWKKIITVNKEQKKSKMLDYVKLIKKLKITSYNYVFFSNFGSVQRIILANLKIKNLFFVDDGVETINRYEEIFVKNKINKFRVKLARFWLFGLKTKIKNTINLFTYFDLKPFRGSKVIQNNLEHFQKKYLKESLKDNYVYLLGQPLVSTNLLSVKDYFLYIDKILSSVNEKIIYIPHRTEVISERLKLYESELFEIKNLNMPVEMYFLENKIYPLHVVSFMTTAFFTLKKLFSKTKFSYVYIPRSKILERHDDVEGAYRFIEELELNKIELDEKILKL